MSDAWVCPECGLDYGTIHPPDAMVALRSFPRRYGELIGGISDDETERLLHARPAPDVWSAVEYTVHVADTLESLTEVIRQMVRQDDPDLSGLMWDPDERAAEQKYNEKSPDEALALLRPAAENAATTVESVGADDWGRQATFPFGERDTLTMMRNAVHEGAHHLRDVADVLKRVRS